GDARRFAAEAAERGAEHVLAIGGDGTANETAWGLLGTSTTLGLVPMGSGNGLARTLGIPLRPAPALATLAQAVPRTMDVGMVNDRPFLNVAGAGFDAQVGLDFHEHGGRGGRRGVFTYVRLSLRRALTYKAEVCVVDAGERRFEGRALVVAFVNGRQYGGGAVLVRGARLDDGVLDVVVIEEAPPLEMVLNAARLFVGGIERFRRYRHLPAASVLLTTPSPTPFHRDGEPEPPAPRLEVSVQPRALRILVPRATAEDPLGPFAPSP
ncbi:MAG TPA: YegS/Rv2252/BmrU family lipid kinase, partial [Vicinamibacteria bacterium]|nr:YegS/Rv2252/BmrU family lipid kinase [Vicinamibacteria bacterium]